MSDFRQNLFRQWAPDVSPWSTWAKPVLFSACPGLPVAASLDVVAATAGDEAATDEAPLDSDDEASPQPAAGESTTPPATPPAPALWAHTDGRTALVLDLPAASAVANGLAAARRGYRPVPLFNAMPGSRLPGDGPWAASPSVAVDLWPAMQRLAAAGDELESLHLSPAAPPAFLLDANRRFGRKPALGPGDFDNRSICFPTDFPSATFLLAHGIRQVVLVQATSAAVQEDLAHTLRRWAEAGIALFERPLDTGQRSPLSVTMPSRFRRMFYPLLAVLKLRRHPLGGFGGMMPIPGGGGFGG